MMVVEGETRMGEEQNRAVVEMPRQIRFCPIFLTNKKQKKEILDFSRFLSNKNIEGSRLPKITLKRGKNQQKTGKFSEPQTSGALSSDLKSTKLDKNALFSPTPKVNIQNSVSDIIFPWLLCFWGKLIDCKRFDQLILANSGEVGQIVIKL